MKMKKPTAYECLQFGERGCQYAAAEDCQFFCYLPKGTLIQCPYEVFHKEFCEFSEIIPRPEQGWRFLHRCKFMAPFCGLRGKALEQCETRMIQLKKIQVAQIK